MPHRPKPFFRTGRGWYVQLGKAQIKLADGPQNSETEDAAWEAFHALMAQQKAAPEEPRQSGLSVAEVFDKFLAWSEKNNAARTYDWYHDHIQGFINHSPAVARQPCTELKPFHVIEWIDSHGEAWSPAYRRGAIIAIQRPFNWAEELGYIPASPIKRIKKPEAQTRQQFVSPEDWIKIRDHYEDGDPFRDLLEVAWDTGCRPQEIKRLEPRHVQLDKHLILIPKEEAKGKKHPRVIYLSNRAEDIIRRHLEQYPDGVIFRNEDGEPWTNQAMSCRFGRLKKHLGTKFCAYDFRHGFGTRKLTEGHNPAIVAEAMGHRSTRMLETHYQHLDQEPEHVRKVLEDREKSTDVRKVS